MGAFAIDQVRLFHTHPTCPLERAVWPDTCHPDGAARDFDHARNGAANASQAPAAIGAVAATGRAAGRGVHARATRAMGS